MVAAIEPVGQKDIADRLGVKQNRVAMWAQRRETTGFPEPRWSVGGRPAWNWADVEKWAKQTHLLRR